MSLVYLRENGLEGIGRFYSTYRGIVINNEDPLKLNRLQIEVPDITQTLVWAYPKGQPGPLQSGAKYLTPEINDVVSWNSNLETQIILSGHTVDGQKLKYHQN